MISGDILGRYKVQSAIGAGGMGEVFLAKDLELERLVALKVLPVDVANDQERVRRFVQEAKAASALNHPNILTIYEIGSDNSSRFIASEYVKGETLRERIKDENLSLAETLDIAIQIVSALRTAHEAGIIHRDIKPENIMIRSDGIVKVLDFGLAKLVEPKRENTDAEAETLALVSTQAGMIMGTAGYMSPEQARGRTVDARSDIFSFGVCLYEMLAGFNPFKGETMADILAAVLQRQPPSLSVLNPEIPEELSRIVERTLRKDADERYQTSAELLADLKRFQQQSALSAFTGLSQPLQSVQTKEAINSLAILPLACSDDDDSQIEYLSDGITESIINALAQISDLNVTPRNTVFRFKGSDRDSQSIGRQLNVRAVLTGRVRQYDENLIIGVELIDVEKDAQIWGEQYRRRTTDIFELQEEIAKEISEKLKLKLTGEEKKRLAKRYTENTEAYQFYLKGRYFVTTKRTEEWIKKGIEYYQQAIELDPTYALAFSGIADAYAFLASSTGGWSPQDAYPKAKAAAERALAIDETLGEAHASLGFFHVLYDWNFPAAEREFKRAIELSPNYPTAHDGYGFYLKAMGRHAQAIGECQTVRRLDPLSPFAHVSLGWAYYFAGEFDHAIIECKNALEIEQDSTFAYRILGFAYLQQGKFDDALSALRKAVIFSSGGLAFEAHLGYAYAHTGKKTEALQVLSDLETINRSRYVSSYYFAVIYLGLGEIDKTFEWLEKAYEERSGFMPFLNVEPMFDSVRSDPRFTDLLRRIGLLTEEAAPGQTINETGDARTAILSSAAAATEEQETLAIVTKTDEQASPLLADKTKTKQNWFLIVLLSLLILTAGFFSYRYFAPDNRQIESIAVMPFVNESASSDIEYLSDGMTETLISSLSQLPNLNVKARSSVFRYKGKETDAQTIGKELNVQAILNGRVVQRGQDLTLYLELVDAQTCNRIWGDQYNRKQADLISLQTEIARDVSQKLKTKLSGTDKQKLAKNYTENTEAYQLYLKGRYYWNKRSAESIKKAIEYFNQAIERDTSYALAYAGLADSYSELTWFDNQPSKDVYPKAKAASLKALELDDELAEAHASLGQAKSYNDWDFAGAEIEYRRAIELNPNYAVAHYWYAEMLSWLGRHDEAIAEANRAQELDPLSPIVKVVQGAMYEEAGRCDESLGILRKAIEADKDFPRLHREIVFSYECKRMFDEAINEWQTAEMLAGKLSAEDVLRRAAILREAYRKDGEKGYWQGRLELLNYDAKRETVSPAVFASIYASLGDKEKTLEWLEKAYQQREFEILFINIGQNYKFLRGEPHFQDLLRRTGLPQ